jgi:hypothetical protein
MAGISATLSREDLAFMADDIGRELIAFLQPEDLVEVMDPEKRKALFDLLSKLYADVPDKQDSVHSTEVEESR